MPRTVLGSKNVKKKITGPKTERQRYKQPFTTKVGTWDHRHILERHLIKARKRGSRKGKAFPVFKITESSLKETVRLAR